MNRVKTLILGICVSLPVAMTSQTLLHLNKLNGSFKYGVNTECGTDYTGGIELDIDNDGSLEVLYGGRARDGYAESGIFNTRLMKWSDGDNAYGLWPVNIYLSSRAQVAAADFNNDGWIDIFVADGHDTKSDSNHAYGLYLNNGEYGFVKQTIKVKKSTTGGTMSVRPTAIDVADFNNDGLPDIVCAGYSGTLSYETVLINKGNFEFSAECLSLMSYNKANFRFSLGTIKAVDLNNDAKMDIVVTGVINSNSAMPSPTKPSILEEKINQVTLVYLNTTENGVVSFEDLQAYNYLPCLGNSNLAVGDFNSDGIMDLFLGGKCDRDLRPKGSEEFYNALWLGDGKGGFSEVTDGMIRYDIRELNATNIGLRAIDYDYNGTLDIILLGWASADRTQSGYVCYNGGDGVTTKRLRVPGASEMGILFGDMGDVNSRHFIFSGYSGDDTYFKDVKGRSLTATQNPTAKGERPAAPQSATATVDKNEVTFAWTPADGANKNTTYEFYVKDASGKIVNNCNSFVGGAMDGIRKVVNLGNANLNTAIKLTLPDGEYTWGVQAINVAMVGSTFVAGNSFVVSTSGIDGVEADDVKILAVNGAVEVVGGEGVVEIYNIAGAKVVSARYSKSYTKELPTGVYLVKVGAVTQKVVL